MRSIFLSVTLSFVVVCSICDAFCTPVHFGFCDLRLAGLCCCGVFVLDTFLVFLAVILQALLAGVNLCDAKFVSACAGGKRGKAPLPRVLVLSFGLCFSFCRPFCLGRRAFWRG